MRSSVKFSCVAIKCCVLWRGSRFAFSLFAIIKLQFCQCTSQATVPEKTAFYDYYLQAAALTSRIKMNFVGCETQKLIFSCVHASTGRTSIYVFIFIVFYSLKRMHKQIREHDFAHGLRHRAHKPKWLTKSLILTRNCLNRKIEWHFSHIDAAGVRKRQQCHIRY